MDEHTSSCIKTFRELFNSFLEKVPNKDSYASTALIIEVKQQLNIKESPLVFTRGQLAEFIFNYAVDCWVGSKYEVNKFSRVNGLLQCAFTPSQET